MRSAVGTVAKNTIFIAASTVVAKALTFCSLFLIMRHLRPALYGKYAVAFSIVAMLGILSELGIATLTVRDVAASRRRATTYFINVLLLRLALYGLTLIAVWLTARLVTGDAETLTAVYLFAAALFFDTVADTCSNFFYAFENTLVPSLLTSLRSAVVLSAVAIAVRMQAGLTAMVLATVIGSSFMAVSMLTMAIRLVKPSLRVSFLFIANLIARALPFAAMALITSLLFRVDILMLSRMKGDLETGLYGAAYRLMEALLFVSAAVNAAALPTMSRFFKAAPEKVREIHRIAFRVLFALGLPAALVLTLCAERVMGIFGKGYLPATPCLRILSWAMFLMFLNRLAGPLLTAAGRQKLLALIMLHALGLNILLNLLLIPGYGRIGASAATLLCEVLLAPTFLFFCRGYQDIPSLFSGLWRSCAAGALVAIFCWIFGNLNLILLLTMAGAVYFLALVAIDRGLHEELRSALNGTTT